MLCQAAEGETALYLITYFDITGMLKTSMQLIVA
jgi:hypothetical protein